MQPAGDFKPEHKIEWEKTNLQRLGGLSHMTKGAFLAQDRAFKFCDQKHSYHLGSMLQFVFHQGQYINVYLPVSQ